jgi:hypothetical protein
VKYPYCVIRMNQLPFSAIKVSTSPIFYEQLFVQKFFAQLLCVYNLGL